MSSVRRPWARIAAPSCIRPSARSPSCSLPLALSILLLRSAASAMAGAPMAATAVFSFSAPLAPHEQRHQLRLPLLHAVLVLAVQNRAGSTAAAVRVAFDRQCTWPSHLRPPPGHPRPPAGACGPLVLPRHSIPAGDDHVRRSRKPAISTAVNREEGPRA